MKTFRQALRALPRHRRLERLLRVANWHLHNRILRCRQFKILQARVRRLTDAYIEERLAHPNH